MLQSTKYIWISFIFFLLLIYSLFPLFLNSYLYFPNNYLLCLGTNGKYNFDLNQLTFDIQCPQIPKSQIPFIYNCSKLATIDDYYCNGDILKKKQFFLIDNCILNLNSNSLLNKSNCNQIPFIIKDNSDIFQVLLGIIFGFLFLILFLLFFIYSISLKYKEFRDKYLKKCMIYNDENGATINEY
jgi:ATP-dependent Zn protease